VEPIQIPLIETDSDLQMTAIVCVLGILCGENGDLDGGMAPERLSAFLK
jgi:hypothetical protein